MEEKNLHKMIILRQMQNHMQGTLTLLNDNEAFEFSLQSLAWGKLSANQKIPESLRLTSNLLSDPARTKNALIELSRHEAVWHDAFSLGKWFERADPIKIRDVLYIALLLSEGGELQAFDLTDAILEHPSSRTGREFALPPEVASLLTGLSGASTDDAVYIPWDSSGQLAAREVRTGASVYLETPIQSVIPSLISILADRPFKVAYADPILAPSAVEGIRLKRFDVAVAFPPFGMRYEFDAIEKDWFKRFPERTRSGTVLSVRHLLSQAQRRVVVGVNNGLLFSDGSELAMRQDLLKRGIVQAVVALPSGLLNYTNISFTILVLDPAGGHQQIKFINADCPRFLEATSKARARLVNFDRLIQHTLDTELSEDAAIVPVADVLANNAQLQVSRYVLPDTNKQLQARLATSETVMLGDVVTTVRPIPTLARPIPVLAKNIQSINVQEVSLTDLPPFGYIRTPDRQVKVERQAIAKNEQQFLRPFDIVLTVRGNIGRLGIVPPDVPPPGEGGWIAGQSAMVLRAIPDAKIAPQVLALQLRSPLGQELINSIVSKASMPIIQLRELVRLQVLVPDPETARRALDALEQEAKFQCDIDRLRQAQTQASAGLWTLG